MNQGEKDKRVLSQYAAWTSAEIYNKAKNLERERDELWEAICKLRNDNLSITTLESAKKDTRTAVQLLVKEYEIVEQELIMWLETSWVKEISK